MTTQNESRTAGGPSPAGNKRQATSLFSGYHNSASSSIPIMRGDGRVVGQVHGDTFYKRIRSNHVLTRPPALASDVQALLDAQRAGAEWMEVTNTDNGQTYRVSIHKFLRVGKLFDRGHGHQIYLPLGEWSTGDAPASEQLTFAWGLT